MMDNKFILEDLTMVLEAIEQVRKQWTDKIEEKTQEYMGFHPGVNHAEAQREIITCQECHEIHQRLVALYSCIGQGTDRYIWALKSFEKQAKRGHLRVERRSKERKGAA